MHLRVSSIAVTIMGLLISARGIGVCGSWPDGRTVSCTQNQSFGILVSNYLNDPPDLSDANKPSPKDWDLALSVVGNYAAGMGAYYADSDAGADFESRLALSISDDIALRFCYSRSGIAYSDSLSWDEEGNSLETEPDFDLTSITAGIQWYRWLDRLRQSGPVIYVSLDAGVAHHSLTVTETFLSYLPDSQPAVSNSSWSSDRPTLRTGMGFLFPIGKSISFDVNMGLDMIWTKTGGPDDPRKAIYGIKGFILHGAAGLELNI